ncbi:MAG: DUF2000 domain-containing protein [Hamadaea sp.]|nr:DUF2000 domain-containing protein [Hamadaea sp.]
MSRTYKTGAAADRHRGGMTVRFETKIAILLRDDLATWQRLNVTAFLASALAAAEPDLVGKAYADADGTPYLAMFRQPVMVFAADGGTVTAAHRRALDRGIPMAIFTEDLFATGNDDDNRAAVQTVARDDLNLVGIALHGPRAAVDKILKGAHLHP